MTKLVTLFLIIVTSIVSNAQTDCNPATITNVVKEGSGNRITWTLPLSGEEVTISQGGDFGYNGIAIGPWNQIRSLGVYHRYTPEHLATFNGGLLTHVIFVPIYSTLQQKPGHTHTIQIYSGGDWGEENLRYPGTLITSQGLSNDNLMFGEENTITLETPVIIDASQELWIGYFCTDIDTIPDNIKYCAGADAGPHKEGLGNIMIYENKWQTYYEYNQAFYNWVIKGKVQTVDDVTVNIFFNENNIANNISGITYFHPNPTGDEHCYKVEVNCLEGGVSPFSNEVCIPGVGIYNYEQINQFVVYPNPAKNELLITNYELRNGAIEIYDVYGRKLLSHYLIASSSHQKIDISSLNPGVYLVRLIDEQGFSVQKFIKE